MSPRMLLIWLIADAKCNNLESGKSLEDNPLCRRRNNGRSSMRELREDVLHAVCATQGQLLLPGMQCQIGSSQKRKRIQRSKRILESKEITCAMELRHHMTVFFNGFLWRRARILDLFDCCFRLLIFSARKYLFLARSR